MRKKAQREAVLTKMAPDQPKSRELVQMSEVEILRAKLAAERLSHANAVAETRKNEFHAEISRIVGTYCEGDKYVVTRVDADAGRIERHLASETADPST